MLSPFKFISRREYARFSQNGSIALSFYEEYFLGRADALAGTNNLKLWFLHQGVLSLGFTEPRMPLLVVLCPWECTLMYVCCIYYY